MGSQSGESFDTTLNGYPSVNGTMSPGYDDSLNYATLFNYKDPSQDLTSLDFHNPVLIPENGANTELESLDDSDSDDVLKYISQMLMEEDMKEKPCMFHDALALQAAEKPFYDALGKKYPPSPNQHPLIVHYVDSPDGHSSGPTSDFNATNYSSSSTNSVDLVFITGSSESTKPSILRTPPIESFPQSSNGVSQRPFGSSTALHGTSSNGSTLPSTGLPMGMNIFSDRESIIQFNKGVEEASKFLPKSNNLVIDLENITLPSETKDTTPLVVKKEDSHSLDDSRGGKIHYREDDEDFEEGRSSKQSAISTEEADLSEMFDRVLLCHPMKHELHCTNGLDSKTGACLQASSQSEGLENNRVCPRKQSNNNNMVDLRSLLILCAQATASDDRRTADELLKQIRKHSSSIGDGSQRLAHFFANALEARLTGTGSQICTALSTMKTTAADMLKAYQFFVRVCPVKKISVGFANRMILKASENASKIHVIDFGILYGFQWPILIQRLSELPGGPPKLCITGIDLPQPGFRPAERVEATGRRLAKYCERFKVEFEFHAIAQKWETIEVEDLKRENDELVVVNCMHRFKNLLDETIMVDSPRNAVLKLIRRIKPDMFLHCVVSGSYNAPFFVTRFREALFHYSTLFDMFDTNASRDDLDRLMFEKEFYGREIMNVVACEGTERVERPETYKQWQVRINRAGFRQLPLDHKLVDKLKWKINANYNKDFVVDVDGSWAMLGWKGRVLYAISAWYPA